MPPQLDWLLYDVSGGGARGGLGEPMRATYTRRLGTETFLGFYNVHQDVLSEIFRKRKGVRELVDAFRRLRACSPHRRLYVGHDAEAGRRHDPEIRTQNVALATYSDTRPSSGTP